LFAHVLFEKPVSTHRVKPEGKLFRDMRQPGDVAMEKLATTKERDPFDEGIRAAAEGIAADANPYPRATDKYALWQDGYETGAQALQSGQTEDS
jgi:hypothetical protein